FVNLLFCHIGASPNATPQTSSLLCQNEERPPLSSYQSHATIFVVNTPSLLCKKALGVASISFRPIKVVQLSLSSTTKPALSKKV
ncbi:hypothetical protein, partial, partial [Absidia glauca]